MIFTLVLEGLAMCLMLTMLCIIGTKDGAAGMAFFYEKPVQDKAIAQGLTTAETIKRRLNGFRLISSILMIVLTILFVYVFNGARGFVDGFLQMLFIYAIMCVYDKLFIDTYWVGHTKAWIIPGTEEFMPYIPARMVLIKLAVSLIMYPATAAIIALVMSFILK